MNKGSWGKIRAFFDLQTEEGFTIKGFKLVEGIKGLFVGFPSQKGSDEEYYECLRWANTTLMKNYYNKQRDSTEAQIKYLYETKDVTFRGFRHKGVAGAQGTEAVISDSFKKTKLKNGKNNYSIEKTKNWENNHTGDGDRFSSQNNRSINLEKGMDSYYSYLKKKKIREEKKKKLAV